MCSSTTSASRWCGSRTATMAASSTGLTNTSYRPSGGRGLLLLQGFFGIWAKAGRRKPSGSPEQAGGSTALTRRTDPLGERLGEAAGGHLAAQVAGAHVVLVQHRVDRLAQLPGMVDQADMIHHQPSGEQKGGRVGNALAGNVGGGTMHCLKDRSLFADIGARGCAQTADQASNKIRQDVAKQVGGHYQ